MDNLAARLEYADRSIDMLDDPDLRGDVLSLGLALLAELTVRRIHHRPAELRPLERRRRAGSSILSLVAADEPADDHLAWTKRSIWWLAADHAAGHARGSWVEGDRRAWVAWWLQATLRDDVPRYEPTPAGMDRRCGFPLLRPLGAVCRQRATSSGYLVDPNTGEMSATGSCPRHRDDDHRQVRALREAWRANGSPSPAANRGGILARYLECDWPAVYRWVSPSWQPIVVRLPSTPRPRLHIVPDTED